MFWRRRRRLDEEVASHLAEETADNIERGMTPDAARNAALRAFGNVAAAKERARERDPFYWFDTVCQDVRFAFRLIARNPWLSVTIVATLTVGIGLNVSVFSLLNGFFLQPWVGTEPDTFIGLHPRYSGKYRLEYSDGGITQPDYVRYRDSAKSLAALAAYRLENLTLSGAAAGRIRGGLISCNMADVIRPAPPLLGRYLTSDDCATTHPMAVAVMSETTWRTRFNGVTLVLRSGASPVIGGLLAGVGLVFALSALMASMLYGVSPRDPLTLAIVPLLLFVAALGAIWIPARRAAALDPLSSLRHD